jgi:putative addiction module component (TIGR02574 family)
MTTAALEAEILKLPRSVRARLAERLISSLDEDDEIEQAWVDEADRRFQAFQRGESKMLPFDEVMAAIRKEFNL